MTAAKISTSGLIWLFGILYILGFSCQICQAEPLHLLSMFYPRTIPAAQPLIYHGNFLGNNYNSNWSKRPKQQNLLSWWYANKRAPGSEFLGKRSSGPPGPPEDELQLLAKRVPGSEFLGKRVPGSEFLGKRVPGSEFLGKRVPGSEFLGKRVPGSEFLGKRVPGSEFLGKRVPGSEFLGKRVPGSEFLGKRVPGSEFLGKRVPGSEFLGKRVPGSEFLGKRSHTLPLTQEEEEELYHVMEDLTNQKRTLEVPLPYAQNTDRLRYEFNNSEDNH